MMDILAANGNIDPVKLTNVLHSNDNIYDVIHQHNVTVTTRLCRGDWSLNPDAARAAIESVPALRDYLQRRHQLAA